MDKDGISQVSRRDATIACLVCAALGAVLTTIVLAGSDIPLKCVEAGNAADWLAVAGTWVIGYGAWKYAREAHRQRLHEYFEGEIRRLRSAFMQVWSLRDRAVIARSAAVQMTMIDLDSADHGLSDAQSACRVGGSILADIVWRPEDAFLLSEAALRAQGVVALGVTQMKDVFARGTVFFEKGKVDTLVAQGFARSMIDIGNELQPDCDIFIEQLLETLANLRQEALKMDQRRRAVLG